MNDGRKCMLVPRRSVPPWAGVPGVLGVPNPVDTRETRVTRRPVLASVFSSHDGSRGDPSPQLAQPLPHGMLQFQQPDVHLIP